MKRYVNYLNGIEAPEGLTARLTNLKPERRIRPAYLYRTAGIAAALALAVGLGVLWRHAPADPVADRDGSEHYTPDIGIIVTDDPLLGDPHSDRREGYEILDGEHATYYTLPRLNIADASGLSDTAMDYTLCPLDGYERDLVENDLVSLFGTDRYREHLGIPEDAEISGAVYFSPEGTASGLGLYWTEGDMFRVCYEVLRGYDVPSCPVMISPDDDYGVTEVDGVRVTTLAYENKTEVKLFVDGFGYKATLYGENRDELAARFVRLVLESRAGLDGIE